MANPPLDFRNFRLLLAGEPKDGLIDEILKLLQEKEALARKDQALEKQLEELKKQIKPAFVKIRVYRKKQRWKKLGRPAGHPGCTRLSPKPFIILPDKPRIDVRTAGRRDFESVAG